MRNNLQESVESSSPFVTRAVSAGLLGQYSNNYHFHFWQKILLQFLGYFPQKVASQVISRFQKITALPSDAPKYFDLNSILTTRITDYSSISQRKPCITIGPGFGGAMTYLSLGLDAIYLPQAFVFTLRGGSPDGDPSKYLNRSLDHAHKITSTNPQLITIQHFDPIHDGWLTKYVNHLRIKLIGFPEQYKSFIDKKLLPGGTVVYFDCSARWLRYQVGSRNYFQVGGWGDIPPEEFLEGSERTLNFAHRTGLRHGSWKLDGYPLMNGMESEWGTEPGPSELIEEFCRHNGYRFLTISLSDPFQFSRLAFETAKLLIQKENRLPAGVLVEAFSQFDSTAALKGSLLPLWLIFNTTDNLRFLREMRQNFPAQSPVFFSPLSTFTTTPDLTPWSDWIDSLLPLKIINIGTRPSHYPADVHTLLHGMTSLRSWVSEHPNPVSAKLSPDELLNLAEKLI